ncbi:MAG: VOC family protein [Candidatus Binataceae bacterium]
MSEDTSHIQEGHHTITPYLYGGIGLVDFVHEAFGAEVTHRGEPDAQGRFHAEVKIGDSMVLIGSGYFADSSMSAATWIYVKDVDATYQLALRKGAKSIREPADQTWGDRVGGVKDESGNTWWIATHKGRK